MILQYRVEPNPDSATRNTRKPTSLACSRLILPHWQPAIGWHDTGGIPRSHPLTAPAVNPFTIHFWAARKKTVGTIADRIEADISRPGSMA